jgi:hypothetical protein
VNGEPDHEIVELRGAERCGRGDELDGDRWFHRSSWTGRRAICGRSPMCVARATDEQRDTGRQEVTAHK